MPKLFDMLECHNHLVVVMILWMSFVVMALGIMARLPMFLEQHYRHLSHFLLSRPKSHLRVRVWVLKLHIDCWPLINKLDLGLPMACKVGSAVVIQIFFKKFKEKERVVYH
jgi:hypothetical protein